MVLDVGSGPDGRRTVLKATGDKEHPANFGRLCTKGATTADMLAAPSRLATALVRPDRGGEPLPELALGHVRNRALTTGITRLFPLSARKR
jgi:predicted molibdopterin-dependent oxidoreductase YjgC